MLVHFVPSLHFENLLGKPLKVMDEPITKIISNQSTRHQTRIGLARKTWLSTNKN